MDFEILFMVDPTKYCHGRLQSLPVKRSWSKGAVIKTEECMQLQSCTAVQTPLVRIWPSDTPPHPPPTAFASTLPVADAW